MQVDVVHSPAFEDQVIEVHDDRLVRRIRELEATLCVFPDLGSTMVRHSFVSRYGTGVRKLVVGSYILLYRHTDDVIEMLACVSGGSVS